MLRCASFFSVKLPLERTQPFLHQFRHISINSQVVSWLKKEGEKVAKGESIVVIESDKADMDVESFSEGILAGKQSIPVSRGLPYGSALRDM